MKKRVLIDARMVGGHGIGMYVEDLARGFATISLDFHPIFLINAKLPAQSSLRNFETQISSIDFLHPKEAVSLARDIQNARADLYHTPSFSSLLRYPCAHVQTIHDLNHLQYGNFIQKGYYRTILLPSARNAKVLSTVSECSRKELLAWLVQHRVIRNVDIIPNSIAIDPPAALSVLEKYSLKKSSYFFSVATLKKHKNLKMLLQAYEKAKLMNPSLDPLVVCEKVSDRAGVITIQANDRNAISQFMAGAKALFFPSLYEGFGRPPLEAASLGTTSIVSDIPINRETLANLQFPQFLNANAEERWTAAFLDLQIKPKIEIAKGDQNRISEKFSIKNQADLTQAMYLRGMGQNPKD